MKHCIVKLFVVVAIALFALPRLYAQDTTITIYGKKFAPGVIVKINGRLVDSANIRRDSAQPSRILYVKFPLSWLNKPPATLLAGGKDAGASLTSNEAVSIVEVGNPGIPSRGFAIDTIYTKPQLARITLRSLNGNTLSNAQTLPDVALSRSNLTRFIVRYENVDGTLNFTKYAADSVGNHAVDTTVFDILDSAGTAALTRKTLKGSGQLTFTVRFNGQSLGYKKFTLALSMTGKTAITRQNYEFNGFCVNEFKILAAYTIKSGLYFHLYDTLITRNPSQLLKKAIDTLNSILARTVKVTPTPDKFLNTRFRLVTEPFRVNYGEQSPDPHLHIDIDNLAEVLMSNTLPQLYDTIQTNMSARNADLVLLITNTDAKPYRAIGSECTINSIPKFIIAEIKYLDMKILNRTSLNKDMPQDYESIRSFLYTEAWKLKPNQTMELNDFFYDKLLLQELRQAINLKY